MPSRSRLGLFLGAFVTLSTLSVIGTILSARLVNHHPAVLLALSPVNRHLLLTSAAGMAALSFFAIAAGRYVLGGFVLYRLGYDYGASCRGWLERQPGGLPGSIRWLERAFDRAWWVVVPVMVGSNAARLLGGARRVPARPYAALLGAGIAGRLALFWWLGQRFESSLRRVLDLIERYQWWIVAAFVVVTFAQSWRKAVSAERARVIDAAAVEAAAEPEAG